MTYMLLLVVSSLDCDTDGRTDRRMEIEQPFKVPFHLWVDTEPGTKAERPPSRARGLPAHLSFLLESVFCLFLVKEGGDPQLFL